jgi:hypothetical protein
MNPLKSRRLDRREEAERGKSWPDLGIRSLNAENAEAGESLAA